MAKKRSPRSDATTRRPIVKGPPPRKPAPKSDAERLDDLLGKSGPGELDRPDDRRRRPKEK
jgi:hypothetical protein